ncbi:DUF4111 domain-containing protein, partial [Escherichia coli]
ARLPAQHQPILLNAKRAYLGQEEDYLPARADQVAALIKFVKYEAVKLLGASQ